MTTIIHALRPGTWSESALKVLRERYLRQIDDNQYETPEEMCWRVADAIAGAEAGWGAGPEEIATMAQRFYAIMVDRLFLPNSPTLMNAGLDNHLQYSACFVLPVEDSIPGIFDAISRAAIIHQSGGGTGFAFSRLRPKDCVVKTSGGKASGPVSFLRVFDAATEAVKQGGRRRGANMAILRVDHPDILEFIDCKRDGGIANFNISVAITDRFMQALERDEDYELVAQPGWPRPEGGRYSGGEVIGHLTAQAVWERIVDAAWSSGDPGLMFIDTVNHSPANPVPHRMQIESTNPCGEQALPPSDACNLGSINLALLAAVGNSHGPIKWDQLEEVTRLAVRFLDNVIAVNPFPLKEIQETVLRSRRIGLGVMGWADLLFRLGIPYDSQEALHLAGEIMAFIQRVAQEETCRLAEERGAFPLWSESIYKDDRPRRNATLTTIAPTGTISIIADCSSGIEPVFALAYEHRVKQPDGNERRLQFINPIFVDTAKREGFYSEALMAEVVRRGTVRGVAGVPESWQRVFVTAHEISPEWHVRMQAAWQAHVDNGVSKTVNLPHEATREDVDRIYRLAYSLNCRGITVFRDGCKGTQVLHVGTEESKLEREQGSRGESAGSGSSPTDLAPLPPATRSPLQPPLFPMVQPRPQVMHGATHRVSTPLGTAYITINETDDGQPFEVFANVGKAGSDTAAVAEALGRLISLCLRLPSFLSARERLETIISQLAGIGGGRPTGFGPSRVRSLPDGIARALAEHLGMHLNGEPATVIASTRASVPVANPVGDLCPECGNATFVNEEGCHKCHTCGYSEC